MKSKKGVFQDYIIWIVIALVLIGFVGYMLIFERSYLSGFIANFKTKLRFGF